MVEISPRQANTKLTVNQTLHRRGSRLEAAEGKVKPEKVCDMIKIRYPSRFQSGFGLCCLSISQIRRKQSRFGAVVRFGLLRWGHRAAMTAPRAAAQRNTG